MGSTPSKSESCMAWCGHEDDAYPNPPTLNKDDVTMHPADLVLTPKDQGCLVSSGHHLLSSATHESPEMADKRAPSTSEHLWATKIFASGGVPLSERDFSAGEKQEGSGCGTEEKHEGIPSFFHSDRDRLVQDLGWSRLRRGPSLAELLRRIEDLGDVDLALSEVHSLQKKQDRGEALTRARVLKRFLLVMGSEGPGLAVKKFHRSRGAGGGCAKDGQRGKWAARTIHFESEGSKGLPDGTPVGGLITWKSKRLLPREQRGVNIGSITKVEHNEKCVWVTTGDGDGKLGFETSSDMNARFLCRSIDFLVSTAVRHNHGRNGPKTCPDLPTDPDVDIYDTPIASDGIPVGV